MIFEKYGINDTSKFGDLINNISIYSYEKIGIDSIFELEIWLKKLLQFESFLAITKKRHRDHLLHACRIASLGEDILNEKINLGKNVKFVDLIREIILQNAKLRELFELHEQDFEDSEGINKKIFQVWYVSALFHDVGYVYEAFTESWKSIEFLKDYPNFKDFYLKIEKNLQEFEHSFFISERHKKYKDYNFIRKFDHAMIGAHIISNLIGESNLVCDLSSIIAEDHSSLETIYFEENPLAFLLVLLDEAQEWQRPARGKIILDQALDGSISDFSPFLEYSKRRAELEGIYLSIDSVFDSSGKLSFKINFKLDYGGEIKILDETNYSYPMMLYLKYKNLQRLRVRKRNHPGRGEHDKLDMAIRKLTGNDKVILDLNICMDVSSAAYSPLSYLWDRQCNILVTKTLRYKDSEIAHWLFDTLRYRDQPGTISFRFDYRNMPRRLEGDFKSEIIEGHETYIRDTYIKEINITANIKYALASDGKVEGSAIVERTITNKTSVPINGYYACIDESIIEGSFTVEDAKINDIPVGNFFEKHLPIGRRDDGIYREVIALYFPFKTPLGQDGIKKINYTVKFRSKPKQMKKYDGIFNGRKEHNIDNIHLVIDFDKNLFKHLKLSRIVDFAGESEEFYNFLTRLKKDGVDKAINSFKPRAGLPLGMDMGDFTRYQIDYVKLKPYNILGVAWIKDKI